MYIINKVKRVAKKKIEEPVETVMFLETEIKTVLDRNTCIN